MSESLATYLTNSPFTPEQERDLNRFLAIIKDNGGHGDIIVRVRDGAIKYINLGEVSKKYNQGAK